PYLARLPSEHIIESRHASLIIQAKDYGLSSYVLHELNWLVGMKGKETVRGWFFLTNYRVVFRAYPRNRLRGQISIFLPTIQHVSDTSVFISKRITVTTKNQRFEFIIWSIAKVIAAINSARGQLTPAKRKDLRALVA